MASPRRLSLPLRFLIFIPVPLFLVLLLFHRSSHPTAPLLHTAGSGSGPSPDPRRFSLLIKLLAYDRPAAFRRCLRSLAAADYDGDRVALHVLLDHRPPNSSVSPLAASHEILDFVDAFPWPHGEKRVHYRAANAGLQAQWIEAWWPGSDNEFAFVVEDDLQVSPLYYRFLKRVVMRYYYDRENYSPYVFGASLQRPRFVAGKHGNKIQLDSETQLFLYQMVGTWGQLLFPKPWKEFRLWYDDHKAKGLKPILQGMKTTGWYKKMGERIWTPWFIKFVHSRGYFNIYTNLLKERALSVSHRDAGVNYGKSVGPDSTLLDGKNLDFNLWELQPLKKLKWYDFCFNEALPGRIVRKNSVLGSVLKSVQLKSTVVLVTLYSIEERFARNLICHLDKAGMKNSIFLGDNSEFLDDLAHRGYPVIDDEGLMFIRSSLDLKNKWNELTMSTVKAMCTSTEFSVSIKQKSFVHMLTEVLASSAGVRLGKLDGAIRVIELGPNTSNRSISEDQSNVLFWSHSRASDSVQKQLENMDLWLVDSDSSCSAVVCHQKQK
ncbi:unnamed protein product [Miscanthus lutarioriparius]|uniref:Uncharacterized protein n=1 Tax=Miscanthus lutarioriparius TaxID=422564 RepID=A0A811PDQ3_9POAL|nr:unnamed protein product [Miscanthus lutarioriparius]